MNYMKTLMLNIFMFVVLIISGCASEIKKNTFKRYEEDTKGSEMKRSSQNLINTDKIEFARTDESGMLSNLTSSFILVLSEKNPEKQFVDIFIKGKTNEAKIYALLGLFSLNREKYYTYMEQLNGDGIVLVQEGCLIFEVRVSDILVKIEDGSLLQKVMSY